MNGAAMHVLIVDGEPTEWGPLPTVWRWPDGTTTSGFDLLDPADHMAAGWLPVTDARPTPPPGQHHGDLMWTLTPETATCTAELVDDPPPPPPSAIDIFDQIRPDQAEALATFGIGVVLDAGTLWDAVAAMAHDNEARPALDTILTPVMNAALALMAERPQARTADPTKTEQSIKEKNL